MNFMKIKDASGNDAYLNVDEVIAISGSLVQNQKASVVVLKGNINVSTFENLEELIVRVEKVNASK